MNALTNIQYLNDAKGVPAFAVVPLTTFEWLKKQAERPNPLDTAVPFEVVDIAFDTNCSALKAWREYLGLTQAEVASRAGMSQSAYSQHENASRLRKNTRVKMALALGIKPEQLDF